MELKKYKSEDAEIITSWIKDEKSLYQWSADRINKFPITAQDLNDFYQTMVDSDRFFPFTFFEQDLVVGHLIIRYPEKCNNVVRFGFVIIAPYMRGSGNGKKMLQLAIDYAKNTLKATKINLGVFANNESAKFCYESVGFKPIGKVEKYQMPIGEWDCIEMELEL